ncbi:MULTISPECIES: GMC family oxidoreductase [unclassified Rhizobium]|uniref:GMC family oxidoreductase n=1 Tax=unclassified Rhizobium TaxID=2613769 RepID=UPI0007EA1028|nr:MULTISPECIES: FAD-dependent oxidoreductase [unclassified Rhizobium]ANM14439.1 glucose-methanol-choline oxidoreductase protein [Rhizobium sp. N324]ANM20824.1 glucose-methanol-choline oxidoreductase protein [Rhizobium sp. N541]ANM27207.1 glucose-methanol-choline oxidoreductase protein [Rhizobium sp. N941]
MPDYIVVGGGSAGCAIAGRLSEDPAVSVTLFEAGPRDSSMWIRFPVTFYKSFKSSLLQWYKIETLKHQNGLETQVGQARVLGGGSSLNAMIYIRGAPEDYDRWAAHGADGWSYKDVLPYFRKAENNEVFSNEAHGQDGPLSVSNQQHTLPLTKAWVKACQEAGIPFNPDFNSGEQKGAGFYQLTTRDGRRCSSAAAYLHAARNRQNLKILTDKPVTRILVEAGRAVGVEYLENGRLTTLRADREVIVSSGAIGSPRLLMLSGIGPAKELRSAGVDVVHDLPGVGQNLQDHTDCFLIYNLKSDSSYDKYKKLRWQLAAAAQYGLFGTGPITSNICEGGAFWWGDRRDPVPDLQYHFFAGAGIEEGVETTASGNGCTLNVYVCRPESRGRIALRSADPTVPPLVDPNYLSHPYDVDRLIDGVRLGQEIMSKPSMQKYVRAGHLPEKPLTARADLEAFVRKYTQGAYHLSGACKIGTDEMAVVDPQLRVRGIDGLRVADTSVMPFVTSGNLNAPAIMIGERAADFLKGNRI